MTFWDARAGAARVVGHRGGRGEGWPAENTLDAFEQARTQGAQAIELDVQASSDGEAVVFHDADLARMTGGRDIRRVDDVTLAALREVELDGRARIPTLADVLAWASDAQVAVNVEMKHDGARRSVVASATARAVRAARADVLLSSFDPLLLASAAALSRSVPRAFLTHDRQSFAARVLQATLRPPFVAALHLQQSQAEDRVVQRCRARGLAVGVWTVNDPDEARRLAEGGVAWIFTDAPGRIRDAIRR